MALYLALAVYGDLDALRSVLGAFPWRILPLVLGLTLVNYAGRLLKWILYLRWLDAGVGARDAARIFGLGMTMVLTPGKAGELLKSWMVKRLSGTPISRTAPAVVAERLTDGLAMLILSVLGLLAFDLPELRTTALVVLALMLAGIVAVWIQPLADWGLGLAERLPVVGPRAHLLHELYRSSYVLLRPPALLTAVGIGLVSWTCEGLAYYLVLTGVGAEAGLATAGKAIFIFSISTIVGAVVATPGGLGGTEGGLVSLGMRLLGLAKPSATAAALLARLATLWFGVALGLVCMSLWPELLAGAED
ncbi:MAG: flippase-like domain-containing protein [Caldilineae bacterium]|nr:flippase-like domain-containing protein [Chloroflexota bacterium]MCB9175959.1 flippase-like domain-containing protein [Caldilineae bacterium]